MRSAIAVRHVPFEDLGSLEPLLTERSYAVAYREAPTADFGHAELQDADLVIVLGGPIGAGDVDDFPFLKPETDAVAERLAAAKPTLGLCLGAQIMARALGAAVYPAAGKEIGWAPVTLTEAGRASPLRHIAPEITPVLHWHGDTFDLPEGAIRLASTDLCPNQAYSAQDGRALAFQFHPEVTARGLESWFVGHVVEIATTRGVDVTTLRADTVRHAETLERQSSRLFGEWLGSLGAA